MLVILLVIGVRPRALARAHKALPIALLPIRPTRRVFVDAHAVARAIRGGGDAAVKAREAAEVEFGGSVGEARHGGEVLAAGARGDDDLRLRIGEHGFGAAAESVGGCPRGMCGGTGGLGEEDEGGFEIGGGDVLAEDVEVVDEGLEGGVVLEVD